MFLNQSIEEIISIVLLIVVFFLISNLMSFLFLKEKKETKIGVKTIIPNLIFYSTIFILYKLAILKNLNIAVFSPNENYEKKWLIISFIISYIFATFLEVFFYNLLSKSKLAKSYIKLICLLNLISLSTILIIFYPKSYVDKNIKSYERILFIPDKFELKLFDNSIVKIDSACSSKNIYTDDSKDFSYEFRIPIIKKESDRMLYSFRLLDKSLEIGGSSEDENCISISIKSIENEIVVVFVQKNPNPNIGWKKEIITDTILFKKVKIENRKAGYYGDTDCDCIQH
ncbi:MAG: hypothetical protein QM535_17765 [Limnohabitans sp.]|nr:hypothetical protein [Limnohabitans sp.]